MNRILVVVCMFLSFGVEAFEPASRPIVTRDKINFHSWYEESTNISNRNLIKGIHGGNPNVRLDQALLTINGLAAEDSLVCISLEYISGSYLATAEISMPPKFPAIDVDLPLEKLLKKFKEPDWNELATMVRISQKKQCDFDRLAEAEYLLPTWGGELPTKVRFLISPGVGSVAKLILEGDSFPCHDLDLIEEALQAGRTIQSYSKVCDAPLPKSCSAAQQFELIVTAYGQRRPGASGVLRRMCTDDAGE